MVIHIDVQWKLASRVHHYKYLQQVDHSEYPISHTLQDDYEVVPRNRSHPTAISTFINKNGHLLATCARSFNGFTRSGT